jgi:hypothetical protein
VRKLTEGCLGEGKFAQEGSDLHDTFWYRQLGSRFVLYSILSKAASSSATAARGAAPRDNKQSRMSKIVKKENVSLVMHTREVMHSIRAPRKLLFLFPLIKLGHPPQNFFPIPSLFLVLL